MARSLVSQVDGEVEEVEQGTRGGVERPAVTMTTEVKRGAHHVDDEQENANEDAAGDVEMWRGRER